LFRLSGHRGQITDLAFLGGSGQGRLASSSKDELVKVWDLDTQHCCQTIACHGGEIWALDVDFSQKRLAVGAADSELRVYAVHAEADEDVLVEMGSVRSAASERAGTVRYAKASDGAALLMRQGAGKVTEVWRVRSDAEAQKRLKRRRKRRREKGRSGTKKDAGEDNEEDNQEEEEEEQLSASDELELIATIRSKHKVSAAAMAPPTGRRAPSRLVLALANNSLEVYEIKESTNNTTDNIASLGGHEVSKLLAIDSHGHRSDIRAVTLSSDDSMVLSTSNSGVKIWNPRSGACIRTIESGYGLCSLFVPGNKHAVVGTKEGTLEILDIAASAKIASIQAHSGPVWSIAALPDGSGFVSGSADKEVKFWEWDLVVPDDSSEESEEEEESESDDDDEDEGGRKKKKNKSKKTKKVKKQKSNGNGAPKPPQLSIAHSRTLTMTDDVLCVRVSPDGKLLAVALLDSTVRVFFTESLKFFLSLYGHKLPVLSMDISSDGTLLATGSADKNLKIWGLDFGDCHRSLFAHNDSVMSVAFVPKTHYVFTAGKDGVVKYWDGDKFEELLQLNGHQGEVWAMTVSSLGDFIVTGSHDRGLRRWERTEEPFFVEEEKEKRLESLFEEDLGREDARPLILGPDGGAVADDGTAFGQVVPAGKKTLETVSAADAIVEALDMASTEEERIEEALADAQRKSGGGGGGGSGQQKNSSNDVVVAPNPLMMGLSPSEYVLRSVSQVRGSELEQAILLLPFTDALRLLGYLAPWLRRGSQVELLCRVATLLLRVHMQQLMATPAARPVLTELQGLLRSQVQGLKDSMGFNLAAIEHLRRVVAEQGGGGNVQGAATAVLPLKRKKMEANK
jgi:U3 small nucleolar RNA-associated protein 12